MQFLRDDLVLHIKDDTLPKPEFGIALAQTESGVYVQTWRDGVKLIDPEALILQDVQRLYASRTLPPSPLKMWIAQ